MAKKRCIWPRRTLKIFFLTRLYQKYLHAVKQTFSNDSVNSDKRRRIQNQLCLLSFFSVFFVCLFPTVYNSGKTKQNDSRTQSLTFEPCAFCQNLHCRHKVEPTTILSSKNNWKRTSEVIVARSLKQFFFQIIFR